MKNNNTQQKSTQQQYVDLINEIGRAFDLFNKKFAKGELITPVIMISSAANMSAYGWFGNHFWKNGKEQVSEINLCAEYFKRDPEQVLETLLHEMAHLYNAQKEIKDCSGAQYHNKHFKVAAEMFGLKVDKSKNRGYSTTSLTDVSNEAIKELKVDKKLFTLYRTPPRRLYSKKYIPLMIKNTDENEEMIIELESAYGGSKVELVTQALADLHRKLCK